MTMVAEWRTIKKRCESVLPSHPFVVFDKSLVFVAWIVSWHSYAR